MMILVLAYKQQEMLKWFFYQKCLTPFISVEFRRFTSGIAIPYSTLNIITRRKKISVQFYEKNKNK